MLSAIGMGDDGKSLFLCHMSTCQFLRTLGLSSLWESLSLRSLNFPYLCLSPAVSLPLQAGWGLFSEPG